MLLRWIFNKIFIQQSNKDNNLVRSANNHNKTTNKGLHANSMKNSVSFKEIELHIPFLSTKKKNCAMTLTSVVKCYKLSSYQKVPGTLGVAFKKYMNKKLLPFSSS